MAEQFDERKRIRIRRTPSKSWTERLAGITVILAGGLLCVLVLAGSLRPPADQPPPERQPTPPAVALRPTPTPPSPSNERLYLATATASQHRIEVLEPKSGRIVYTIDGGRDLALAPDGQTLYVAHRQELSAHDAATGAERWRVELHNALDPVPGGPLTILLAPNGRRVHVITRQHLIGRGGADAVLQAFDAATGARLDQGTVLLHWDEVNPPFFSRGGRRLYVPAGKVLFALNADTGRLDDIGVLPDDDLAFQIGANNELIYIIASRQTGKPIDAGPARIATLATFTLATSGSLPLRLKAGSRLAPMVALDPRDRMLALQTLPEAAATQRIPGQLVLWDTITLDTRTIPLRDQLALFAFGTDGRSLYAVIAAPSGSGDRIVRYAFPTGASQANEPQVTAHLPAARIVRLLVGPTRPLDFALPPSDYLPADQRILPTPLPHAAVVDDADAQLPASAPIQPQGIAAPVAWVQVPTNVGFDVLAIDAAGQTTVLGHNIAALIERPADDPGAAPLLAFKDGPSGRWVLRDIEAARDVTIELDAIERLGGCVMAPGGGQIACATPGAMAVISTLTGTVTMLATSADLRAGTPRLWLSDGIYGYSLQHGTRLLWRMQPGAVTAGGELTHTLIMMLNENDRFAIAPAHGMTESRILYSYAGAGELRVRDVATRTNLVLGPSVSNRLGLFALAPNGGYAAYLRPATAGYDLIGADLDSGIQQVWVADAAIVPGSLTWNRAGDQLLYRTLEPADSPQRERLHIVSAPDGFELGERALPGSTIVHAAFNGRNDVVALVYENLQPALIIIGPDTTARIAVPVSLGQGRPTLAYVP